MSTRITCSIRHRTTSDDPRLAEISNSTGPEFPAETAEDLRHWFNAVPKGTPTEQWVAEADGEIVGWGFFTQLFWTAAKDHFAMDVFVEPNRWGQGIGSTLYDHLLARLRDLGAVAVQAHYLSSNPRSVRFVEDRGFAPTGNVHCLSRLHVSTANLEGYDGIEERMRSAGITVTTVAEQGVDNEPFLRAVHGVDERAGRDSPSSIPYESVPYEVWKQQALEGPNADPACLFVAMDGTRPAGLAFLRRQGESAAWNSFTGVDREYRGRGVARLLKLKTIEWSRANSVDWIYTGNDASNSRMLAVNVRLGYQPLPQSIEVQKQLA